MAPMCAQMATGSDKGSWQILFVVQQVKTTAIFCGDYFFKMQQVKATVQLFLSF